MIGRFWERWQCRYINPLLVPFSESELDERTRSRVLSHLDHCESCRAELADLAAMGDFFRANPPTPANAPTDLWTRLEAQIAATTPVTQPERPLPVKASPAFQWRSFWVSFAQASPVVAMVVLGSLFAMNQLRPTPTTQQTDKVSFGSTVANNSPVTILLPKPARKIARAKVTSFAKAATIARAAKPALSLAKRKAIRPATRVLVAQNRTSSRLTARRSLMPDATQARASTLIAQAKPAGSPMAYKAAKESIVGLRMVAMADVPRNTPLSATRGTPVALSSNAEGIQAVSWETNESENVAADAAVDTATDLHRQQTIFSYGRR